MPYEFKKVSDEGTKNPVVARITFQWIEILPWFEFSEHRKSTIQETLFSKVQPHLLAAEALSKKYKDEVALIQKQDNSTSFLETNLPRIARDFISELCQSLENFAQVFSHFDRRKVPKRNYAALAKWATKRFGSPSQLYKLLHAENKEWIRRVHDLCKAFEKIGSDVIADCPSGLTWTDNDNPATAIDADIEKFGNRILPFFEEALMSCLLNLPQRAPVTFTEIPEKERDPTAPVRFRAMSIGNDGELIPAGKVSQTGSVIPNLQRLLQQGQGRPIIATYFQGEWFVASGSKLYHSPRWRTFHDFLQFYIKDILGGEWANIELKKPKSVKHPLMVWYETVTRYSNSYIRKGINAPLTSLPAAYLGLAYNLYLISHNNGAVHELLIKRLQHPDQFYGAYFEAEVAGKMIQAGFNIELEDESDSKTSHCEFTATHRASGQKYSVEAKIRTSKSQPPKIGNQLYNALKKKANHTRLVFIEVNDEECLPEDQEKLLHEILEDLRKRENTLTIEKEPAPAAFLVVSNNPPSTVDRPHMPAFMIEGYKISDFKVEGFYSSLREALDARNRHAAMFSLTESLRIHNHIPVSFDGEIPAFASSQPTDRLLIGKNYCITTPQGVVKGFLKHAIVNPEQKSAFCCFRGENEQDRFVTIPLSDQEIQAYRESPRTFFGKEESEKQIRDPLRLFDWMLSCYKKTSKKRLLELFAESGAVDLKELSEQSQEKLSEIFAERMTMSAIEKTGLNSKS